MMGLLRSLARRGTGYAYRYETSGSGLRGSNFALKNRIQIVTATMPRFEGRTYSSEGLNIDLDYLRAKGYGHKSPQQIRERQKELGLLKTCDEEDGESTQDVDEEFGSCEIDMEYLRAKGYGHKSAEAIRQMQRRLGIVEEHSVDGEDHLGVLGQSERNAFSELFATFERSASGRPRWILDANFVINLFQTARNQAEATTKDAATEIYGKLQRDGAEMLFPEVCLAEAAHFLRKQNRDGMLLANVLDGMFEMVTMKDTGDWRRVQELHSLHSANDRISMVDCCIVSIAENLGVINLATFDRRHMLMVKPKHTEVFNILP